jgi:lysophospholipase L1-like esterase
LLARDLGMDHINLGLGGACHCEPELVSFIAERSDWPAATLALSVNMGPSFTLGQFAERVRYFIDRVAGSNTERPVFAITLYPHFRDFGLADSNGIGSDKSAAFRQALREAVAECPHPNVHLIEGDEVLTTAANLTPDLIHPSDYGMIEMAANLARVLRSRLD